MNDIKDYLKNSGYDRFLSVDDLKLLSREYFENKSSDEIAENSNFFFYFLIKGQMDIYYPDKNGKNHLLARVYPEDYQLGGMPRYFKTQYNSLNSYIVSLSKDAVFYGLLPEVAEKLFKNPEFALFVFEKYYTLSAQVIQENYFRSIFSLEEYLAYILYNHAEEGEYTVTSYSVFATLLKCDRTNLYRCLTSLEDQGIIQKDGKTIKILCYDELQYIFEEKL